MQDFPENGASRTRTDDLLGAIQALFQLSYSPATRMVAAVQGPKRGGRSTALGE
jgi:hypothetical protein